MHIAVKFQDSAEPAARGMTVCRKRSVLTERTN